MKPETDTSQRPLFFSSGIYDKEKTAFENFEASDAYQSAKSAKADAPLAQVWAEFENSTEFFCQIWRNEDGQYVYPQATEEYEADEVDAEGNPKKVKRMRIPSGKGDELTSTLMQDGGIACPMCVLGFKGLSKLGPAHHPAMEKAPKLVMKDQETYVAKLSEKSNNGKGTR
jgi:hypothetical protein